MMKKYIVPKIHVRELNIGKFMEDAQVSETTQTEGEDSGAKSSSTNFLDFGFNDSSNTNNTGWSDDY